MGPSFFVRVLVYWCAVSYGSLGLWWTAIEIVRLRARRKAAALDRYVAAEADGLDHELEQLTKDRRR